MKCPNCGYEIPTYREFVIDKSYLPAKRYPVYKCEHCEFSYALINLGRFSH